MHEFVVNFHNNNKIIYFFNNKSVYFCFKKITYKYILNTY